MKIAVLEKVAIFDEINKELNRQKRKSPWLANEVGTSTRNMYDILKKRKDIYVGDLFNISVALKKNFFRFYMPFIEASISATASKQNDFDNKNEEAKTKITMSIKYPESQTEDIGTFLKHVKSLAIEYGFEVE